MIKRKMNIQTDSDEILQADDNQRFETPEQPPIKRLSGSSFDKISRIFSPKQSPKDGFQLEKTIEIGEE